MPNQALEITIVNGANQGDRLNFPFETGSVLHIGRSQGNDLVVPDHKVAKFHATIEQSDDRLLLKDLDSHNGTYLMGFPVKEESLKQGDEFRVGDTVLAVSWVNPKSLPSEKAPSKSKLILPLAIAALLLVLVLLMLPDNQHSPKPTPLFGSSAIFGNSQEVRFKLPAGAVLVEFEAKLDTPLSVSRDNLLLGRVAPSPTTWSKFQLIVRDNLGGAAPELCFKPSEPKPWQIRRVRQRTLSALPSCLGRATALASELKSSMNGLERLLSTLQSCISTDEYLEGGLLIQTPTNTELPEKLPETLRELAAQRIAFADKVTGAHHIELLTELSAALDSELWRVSLYNLRAGLLAVKAKNYRQSLIHYQRIDQIFSDKQDYRYTEVRSALEKAIPHSVMKRANHYLKGAN